MCDNIAPDDDVDVNDHDDDNGDVVVKDGPKFSSSSSSHVGAVPFEQTFSGLHLVQPAIDVA